MSSSAAKNIEGLSYSCDFSISLEIQTQRFRWCIAKCQHRKVFQDTYQTIIVVNDAKKKKNSCSWCAGVAFLLFFREKLTNLLPNLNFVICLMHTVQKYTLIEIV